MKAKNKTILVLILVFAGITVCYSQGWTDSRLPLGVIPLKMEFTCKKQGPLGDKTVVVYVKYNGKGEIPEVSAKDKTDPENPLDAKPISQPYFQLREKKPNNPEVRAGQIENTGPDNGSIICTRKNYPVFVWRDQAWFIYGKKAK